MIELIPHASNGIDFKDFELGFTVFTEGQSKYIEKFDDSSTEYGSWQEMLEKEEQNIVNKPPIDERMSMALEDSIYTLNILLGEYGPRIVNLLENRINKSVILFYKNDGDEELRSQNFEMVTDYSHTISSDLIRWFTISSKLVERIEKLREFWGDNTDKYVKYIIEVSVPCYTKIGCPANWTEKIGQEFVKHEDLEVKEKASALTLELGNKLIKTISSKHKRKVAKEEARLIFSLLGLLSIGFNASFPIMNIPLEREDFISFCQAVNKYSWWSLFSKQRVESVTDGEEPLDLQEKDSIDGPHYTLDYSDLIRMIQNSNGEYEFNMCYNTYTYESDGVEKQIFYKKNSYEESTKSLKEAEKIGNWMQNLFLKEINFHNFRVRKEGHRWNGLSILQVIDFSAGKRYTNKKVSIVCNEGEEPEEVKCKKMSEKILVDFHEKKLRELFWGLYKDQQLKGIIVSNQFENMM